MEIPQKAKTELRQIYFKQTGTRLTKQQTEELAQDLFCLIEVIYQPIPKEWLKNYDVN